MTATENTVTAIVPRGIDEARALASTLSKASLLPVALRGKEPDVLMTILAGAELGLAPIQSIRLIHIIDGKPAMSADLIAGLCLSKPVCEYVTLVESTGTKATYAAKRRGAPAEVRMSFDIEQAKKAGLLTKGNWSKYPDAMLRARCVAALCRAVFPDLVGGLYDYDSGELEAKEPEKGAIIDSVAQVVEQPAPEKKARRMKIQDVVVTESPVQTVEQMDPPPQAPKPTPPPPQSEEVAALVVAIDSATRATELTALVPRMKKLDEAQRDMLRPRYAAKLQAVVK